MDGRGRADDAAVAMDGAGVEVARDADKSDADERTPAQEWGLRLRRRKGGEGFTWEALSSSMGEGERRGARAPLTAAAA